MKAIIINADTDSSVKLLMDIARKMNFKARILDKEKMEDAVLLALMNQRKQEASEPVSKTYDLLRKVK